MHALIGVSLVLVGIGGGNPDSNSGDGGNAGQVSSAGCAVTKKPTK